ncbi:MAG: hypothetical protein AAF630_19395 [Cyanobacteria bacterium P01_C01_bin.38]
MSQRRMSTATSKDGKYVSKMNPIRGLQSTMDFIQRPMAWHKYVFFRT